MADADISEEREILFSFWHEIPMIKIIPQDKFETIGSHAIRNAMIQVLRKGLEDESASMKRYALNLAELLPLIEAYIEDSTQSRPSLKRTALYHHRDILVEHDILQEVATILEGKRYVTYYGRTARAFIGDHHSKPSSDANTNILRKALLANSDGKDQKELDPLLQEVQEDIQQAHELTLQWIEEHVSLIHELDLDAIQLYTAIKPFFSADSKAFKKINEILQSH